MVNKLWVFLTEKEKKAVDLFVQKVKELLGDRLVDLKMFGSKVRGSSDDESDIDILIILKEKSWEICSEISKISSELSLDYDCVISPVIYSEFEHNRNRYFNTLLFQSVNKEGITL